MSEQKEKSILQRMPRELRAAVNSFVVAPCAVMDLYIETSRHSLRYDFIIVGSGKMVRCIKDVVEGGENGYEIYLPNDTDTITCFIKQLLLAKEDFLDEACFHIGFVPNEESTRVVDDKCISFLGRDLLTHNTPSGEIAIDTNALTEMVNLFGRIRG